MSRLQAFVSIVGMVLVFVLLMAVLVVSCGHPTPICEFEYGATGTCVIPSPR